MTAQPTSLSGTETLALTALFLACLALLLQTILANGAPLLASLAFAGLAFAVSYAWIRWTGEHFIKAGLRGKDLSKKEARVLPETMGAISAAVYLLCMALFMPFGFYRDIVAQQEEDEPATLLMSLEHMETGRFLHRFPHDKIEMYYSAGWSLAFMFILGLADDIFDIRWRHKIWIPFFASIPLLMTYHGSFGVTDVVVPTALRAYLGADLIRLGWVYYVYMAMLSNFAPNSINILAGINGIEVGQAIVVALLIALNDAFYLLPGADALHPATDAHLFSLYLLLPFLGVSLSLLMHNWYPARVFVGDTYCYFAGMLIAIDAILNHFSKTLLLLLVPQIFNFVYSCPQLFGLVPCPRHRMPRFNARTGWLEVSWAEYGPPADRLVQEEEEEEAKLHNGHHHHHHRRSASSTTNKTPSFRTARKKSVLHPLVQRVLKVLAALRLLQIETEDGEVVRSSNFTLINLWLVWFGPRREDQLAAELLAMQACVGLLGLVVRHTGGRLVFGYDNT